MRDENRRRGGRTLRNVTDLFLSCWGRVRLWEERTERKRTVMGWISIFLLPMTEESCKDEKGNESAIYISVLFWSPSRPSAGDRHSGVIAIPLHISEENSEHHVRPQTAACCCPQRRPTRRHPAPVHPPPHRRGLPRVWPRPPLPAPSAAAPPAPSPAAQTALS